MSLTNKTPATTYGDLLYVNNSNAGVTSTEKQILSGNGNGSCLTLSDRSLTLTAGTDNTSTLNIKNAAGDSKLLVDTTNSNIRANGVHVNTQYAHFGITTSETTQAIAGYHYPLLVGTGRSGIISSDQPNHFGNGTDPATTFTTANTTDQKASDLVPYIWYVPDNITIDSVSSIEGADAATGDTTRMHMMGYTFTSGSTSCLTSGTLLAHNSDVTNAGNEQVYLSNWTIDSANVLAGKVIITTFESDSTNSDYSYQITIKYHLTG